jgi:hypothetical protein
MWQRISLLSLAIVAMAISAACSSDDPTSPVNQTRGDTLRGNITADRILYSDTVYVLSGFVKVTNGVTLTIQAGTKIVGDLTVPGSALFILRGAKIEANGTAANPIVFTSARAVNDRTPGDWGGLIIVGNATVNRTGAIVEGSDANINNGNPPGITYSGGTDDNDNSGTLRYVRVGFAGYGVAQDAELNSFTFAAVGRGTTLEYLQSVAGLDDSFEWFGGTVDGRYFVSYEAGDDHFDASEGYRGRNQFLIGMQTDFIEPRAGAGSPSSDPSGFEIDGCAGTGCTLLFNSEPFTMPVFANFTLLGPGPGVLPPNGGIATVLRRGAAGVYVNGIVGRWRIGMSVRDANTNDRRLADSLNVMNVLFVQNEATLDPSSANFTQPANFTGVGIDSLAAGIQAHTLFTNIAPLGSIPLLSTLDWSLAVGSAARTGGLNVFPARIAARAGTFVTASSYRGAADPNGVKWWQGWTTYARQ